MSFNFSVKKVLLMALGVLLLVSFGCGTKNNGARVVDGKLVAEEDGYIRLTCYEFWELMNGDIFRQNFLEMSNYEFGREYNGKMFAISGTLKHNIAFDTMQLYDGDKGVIGGSAFDYDNVLKNLGVSRDKDYDGKNVVIRLTLREGDFVTDTLRAYPSVVDYSIEAT